jgi:hypothetical protein
MKKHKKGYKVKKKQNIYDKKELHYRYSMTAIVNALEDKGIDLSSLLRKKEAYTDFEKHFFAAIIFLSQPSSELPSQRFHNFLASLRKALEADTYRQALLLSSLGEDLKSAINILHAVCEALFTDICLYDYNATFLQEIKDSPSSEEESSPLPTFLSEQHEKIKRGIRKKRSLWKTMASYIKREHLFAFDPLTHGNTPFVLFSHDTPTPQGSQAIENLRFAVPTYEDAFSSFFFNTPEITPEFLAFIEAYKRTEKHHVYINLQNCAHDKTYKKSLSRCRTLERLTSDNAHTITVATLSKDSLFYWQQGKYEGIAGAYDFKTLFFQKLFIDSPDSGYYIPLHLITAQDFDIKEDTKELLDMIHNDIFGYKALLSAEERRDFIEIAYLALVEYIIIKTKANTYSITCRDSIDRGPSLSGLFYYYTMIKNGKNEEEIRHNIETILFAPALLAQQRAMHEPRFTRMVSALTTLTQIENLHEKIPHWNAEKALV